MTDNPNQHVEEYLEQYISFPHPPEFAVLIEGPWGSGKTYLIKKFLEKHFEEKSQYAYISLYGLQTLDEIESAVFQAIYPALYSKAGKFIGKAAKSALKFVNLESDLKVSDLLGKPKINVFIFDDLERVEMPLNRAMGYINEYVEHDGCKVIVLANEERMQGDCEYKERKEKLIGKSFSIQPNLKNALSQFIKKIDNNHTSQFLTENFNEISSLYNQSKIGNLRILQQTLWDFDRFYKTLKKEQANTKIGVKLLRIFLAMSFEFKSGKILTSDINPRPNKMLSLMQAKIGGEASTKTSLEIADDKYPETDLFDPIISDELLVDFLKKGLFLEDKIQTHFVATSVFPGKRKEPAWRTVWHVLERSEEEFWSALKELNAEFEARKFTTTGEILHVFGIRLLLSEAGFISDDKNKVINDCERYVDDLYEKGQIEPTPLNSSHSENYFRGYDGLGMQKNDSEEFRELFNYLISARRKTLENSFEERSRILMKEMKENPDLFFRRLNLTNSDENTYGNTPVLNFISPDEFAAQLLLLNPNGQRTVLLTLHTRYDGGRLEHVFSSEKDWLGQLCESIEKHILRASQLTKYRITEFMNWYLVPILNKTDS